MRSKRLFKKPKGLLFFLLLSFFCFGEEIEVHLETQSDVKPLYIARVSADTEVHDARYLEELRNVLVFDFNTGGFLSTLSTQEELEASLDRARPQDRLNLSFWKEQKVAFLIVPTLAKNGIHITVFNIEKGSSKQYPVKTLTKVLAEDRKALHRVADAIHRDLFGVEGVASLRLIYSQRMKSSQSKQADWRSEIWIQDADGANSKQVTFENSYCITPSFYPQTAGHLDPSFFFVSFKGGQSKIYRASLQNPKPELVIELRGNQLLPTLNAKGTQMAFIADVAGRADLFIQSFDPNGEVIGRSRQLYSRARATQASPSFSPDGKKLVFVSDQDGPPRIYAIDIPSRGETKVRPRLLTEKNRENTSPAWSPDGTKLAYSAKVDGIRQIWIFDFETKEERPLTRGPLNKENPSWAPDSFHLVYNTDEDQEGQLFLINLSQKEATQITSGAGQKRFPSWETRRTVL
jgi:TolB protein